MRVCRVYLSCGPRASKKGPRPLATQSAGKKDPFAGRGLEAPRGLLQRGAVPKHGEACRTASAHQQASWSEPGQAIEQSAQVGGQPDATGLQIVAQAPPDACRAAHPAPSVA